MPVSTRTRFEVFKRDGFTCQYCGRKPPEALLHVDHIIPRARGGEDESTNLVTACSECNLGKAAVPLGDVRPMVSAESVAELAERVAQSKAYAEWTQERRAQDAAFLGLVNDAWATAFGAQLVEQADGTWWQLPAYGLFPRPASVRMILKLLPLEMVLEAVDITAGRWPDASDRTCRYFYGVCWRRIRDRSGSDQIGDVV
jgi:HNH endonuclease